MNGIFVLDKPQGFTSFDAVAKLRGITRERKIGHGGTLDPMATGVLPIFMGNATKALDLDPDNRKEYVAEIRTGIRTDTGDITGKVLEEGEPFTDIASFEAALPRFTGSILQVPPMYSAIAVGGRRLYDIAREGRTVERPAREIYVDSVKVEDFREEDGIIRIRVACRKGTYIRTLAEDIMNAAGGIGTLCYLRRTRSGSYREEDCITLDEAQKLGAEIETILKPVETVFAVFPEVVLNPDNRKRFLNGIPVKYLTHIPEGRLRIRSGEDFLGIGEMRENELYKIKQFI